MPFSKFSFLQRTTCRYILSCKRATCSRQHYCMVIFRTSQAYPHIPHSPPYTRLPQVTWSLTPLLHRMYTISIQSHAPMKLSEQMPGSAVCSLQSSHRGSLHTARATHCLSDRRNRRPGDTDRHGMAHSTLGKGTSSVRVFSPIVLRAPPAQR